MPLEIALTRGKVAIVDNDDFAFLNKFKWHAVRSGNTWYASMKIRTAEGKRGNISMHRFMFALFCPNVEVDHIDLNGLNNIRNNLRVCGHAENIRNRGISIRNRSGFKGVSWHSKAGKWRADIRINKQNKFLGYYATAEEAHRKYMVAASNIHGEFARFA